MTIYDPKGTRGASYMTTQRGPRPAGRDCASAVKNAAPRSRTFGGAPQSGGPIDPTHRARAGPPPRVAAALVALAIGDYTTAAQELLAHAEKGPKVTAGNAAPNLQRQGPAHNKPGWPETSQVPSNRWRVTEMSVNPGVNGTTSTGSFDANVQSSKRATIPGAKVAGSRVMKTKVDPPEPSDGVDYDATEAIKKMLFSGYLRGKTNHVEKRTCAPGHAHDDL